MIFYLFFLLIPVNGEIHRLLQNCASENVDNIIGNCSSDVAQMEQLLNQSSIFSNQTQIFKELCETTSCLNDIGCQDGLKLKKKYDFACDEEELTKNVDAVCLHNFFFAVYKEEYNCTDGLGFISNDIFEKRNAFLNGKSCFMEVIQKECKSFKKILEYLTNTEKYEVFVEHLTTSPEVSSCKSFFHKGDHSCVLHVQNAQDHLRTVKDRTMLRKGPLLTEAIAVIRKALECLEDKCHHEKLRLNKLNGEFTLMNTHFANCFQKILNDDRDISEYACFPKNGKFLRICKAVTENEECVKEIFEDNCGEEGLQDWDDTVKFIKSNQFLQGC